MANGKALNRKPYAGNAHMRFDEGEVAPAVTPGHVSLRYGKGLLAIAAATAVLTSSATVYWRGAAGQALDWYGTVSGHSYWNENEDGTGTWRSFPSDENAHVKNGGIAVVGNGVSVQGTAKLVLNFNATTPSCIRVEEGGVLSYPCVYVTHGSKGSGGLLHVNGGAVTVGGGADDDGLQVPSVTAYYPNRECVGNVLVSSGTLDVFSCFSIAVATNHLQYQKRGNFVVSNGTVTTHCDMTVGRARSLSYGTVNVSGGRLQGDPNISLYLRNGSRLFQDGGAISFATCIPNESQVSLSGGTADFGKLQLKKGSVLDVSGTASLTGGLTLWDDEFSAGATNRIDVSGGTLSVTNFRGWINGQVNGQIHAWINAVNPFRFRQTGGNVSLDAIYTNSGESHDVRIVVDGGTFFGGPVAVFEQPFYFCHSGSASVSVEKFTKPSANNGNTNAVNCLVEHVIAHGKLSPMHHTTAQSKKFYVFGHNVVRPAGGVQIVTNDTLPLVVCDQTAAPDTTYCSGTPDASLWSAGRIGSSSRWGVTLVPGASVGSLAGGALAFAATPVGYASLPTVKTNGLVRYTASLQLELHAASKNDIANGLEAAGYENVRVSDDLDPWVSFDVPHADLVHGASNAKLLFDFTETPCPDQFVVGEMSFPVTTNALVKSVSLAVVREGGFMILFR